jgi:hypothetical protein
LLRFVADLISMVTHYKRTMDRIQLHQSIRSLQEIQYLRPLVQVTSTPLGSLGIHLASRLSICTRWSEGVVTSTVDVLYDTSSNDFANPADNQEFKRYRQGYVKPGPFASHSSPTPRRPLGREGGSSHKGKPLSQYQTARVA